MTKTRKTKEDNEEKIVKENIQKRFKSMFSGKGEPLSNMSIQEVEALKTRVAEAEAKLGHQSPMDKNTLTTIQESDSQSSVVRLNKDIWPNMTMQPMVQKNLDAEPAATKRKRKFGLLSSKVFNRRLRLGTKLPLIVIGILIFAFLITTFLSVWFSRTALANTLKETLVLQTSSQAEIIRSHLIWTRSMAVDLAAASGVTDYSKEAILKTIESTLAKNDQVFGSTIA